MPLSLFYIILTEIIYLQHYTYFYSSNVHPSCKHSISILFSITYSNCLMIFKNVMNDKIQPHNFWKIIKNRKIILYIFRIIYIIISNINACLIDLKLTADLTRCGFDQMPIQLFLWVPIWFVPAIMCRPIESLFFSARVIGNLWPITCVNDGLVVLIIMMS